MYADLQRSIRDLLHAKLGDRYTVYFDGAPDTAPPNSAYPCISVQKMGGSATIPATGTDHLDSVIHVVVMQNSKDFKNDIVESNTSMRDLMDRIEKRTDTGDWDENSVVGVLRLNYVLSSAVIQLGDMRWEYDQVQNTDGTFIKLCTVEFTATERINVLNRD